MSGSRMKEEPDRSLARSKNMTSLSRAEEKAATSTTPGNDAVKRSEEISSKATTGNDLRVPRGGGGAATPL